MVGEGSNDRGKVVDAAAGWGGQMDRAGGVGSGHGHGHGPVVGSRVAGFALRLDVVRVCRQIRDLLTIISHSFISFNNVSII